MRKGDNKNQAGTEMRKGASGMFLWRWAATDFFFGSSTTNNTGPEKKKKKKKKKKKRSGEERAGWAGWTILSDGEAGAAEAGNKLSSAWPSEPVNE